MASTKDSCPDELLNKVDLQGLKAQYRLDGIYLNKPRHWVFDQIKLPVGAIRNTNGMDWYWMANSHMPANVKIKPGFLTYKHVPVERKSKLTFKAGKPVFLMDDPKGNTWVMKSYSLLLDPTMNREKVPQMLAQLKLPEGWNYRVEDLDQDLVLVPESGIATIVQDNLDNTYDLTGPGFSNLIP